ncbi:MAG: hypothetical protein H0W61_04485 [Bacteroidetes bacterium]|nr:hypothetical protein [Bacteroidota bacterium]
MVDIFKTLAQYTFIVQGFAFPLLLIVTCYAIYWGLTNKSRAKLKNENGRNPAIINFNEAEVLKPLKCTNCGGVLLINSAKNECLHCGCKQSVPIHYLEIFEFREEAGKKIQLANKYWKKVNYITSPLNRFLLLVLVFWFVISFIILIVTDSKDTTTNTPSYNWYMVHFGAISIGTLFFWIIVFLTIRGMIGNKLRKFLPELQSSSSVLSTKETVACSQCAAPILFNKNDVGCVCSYCGVETYRVIFAKRMRDSENRNRENAKFSLIEAMRLFEEAKEDVIGGAIILPAILIVIPSVLILAFYILPKLIANGFANLF